MATGAECYRSPRRRNPNERSRPPPVDRDGALPKCYRSHLAGMQNVKANIQSRCGSEPATTAGIEAGTRTRRFVDMNKKILAGGAVLAALALVATGCATSGDSGDGGDAGGDGPISVGFAQTGSESGWRSANTESMKTAFSAENGFELTFNAADNDTAAQIAAVRDFINQGVDAIVIAPIVEDGWDDVLQEAADAGIPVVLEDRTVSASDDLYASWVGLDFRLEGVMAGQWAAENFGDTATKMVVLEGTTGSAPANERAKGFDEAIGGTSIEKIDSQTGDFTRDGGKTVMEGFIQKYGIDGIDLLYAHNDD